MAPVPHPFVTAVTLFNTEHRGFYKASVHDILHDYNVRIIVEPAGYPAHTKIGNVAVHTSEGRFLDMLERLRREASVIMEMPDRPSRLPPTCWAALTLFNFRNAAVFNATLHDMPGSTMYGGAMRLCVTHVGIGAVPPDNILALDEPYGFTHIPGRRGFVYGDLPKTHGVTYLVDRLEFIKEDFLKKRGNL